jgi:hypothetical protein
LDVILPSTSKSPKCTFFLISATFPCPSPFSSIRFFGAEHRPWTPHCALSSSPDWLPLSLRPRYVPTSAPNSATPSPCRFFSVRDQVSHPHKTSGRIIVLCVLIFMFLENNRKI